MCVMIFCLPLKHILPSLLWDGLNFQGKISHMFPLSTSFLASVGSKNLRNVLLVACSGPRSPRFCTLAAVCLLSTHAVKCRLQKGLHLPKPDFKTKGNGTIFCFIKVHSTKLGFEMCAHPEHANPVTFPTLLTVQPD